MINIDIGTKNRIGKSNVKISDKLFVIARYVEEKYSIVRAPDYWADAFSEFKEEDRIYYKTWLWLCYVEWESIIPPVEESEIVYGTELSDKLKKLEQNGYNDCDEVEKYLNIDGQGGKVLFQWAKDNLIDDKLIE